MSLYPSMRKQGKSKGKRKEIYPIDHTAGLSARQMAAMFDIDTDSDDDFGGGGGRSGRVVVRSDMPVNRRHRSPLAQRGDSPLYARLGQDHHEITSDG